MSESIATTRTSEAATAQIPSLGKHVPALDGLRGLAILVVMCFHSLVLRADMGTAANFYLKVGHAGWMGVDLFFVLSGFLITGILHDAKGTPRYFTTFYARRSLRIFPLYYLFLVFAFLIVPAQFRITPEAKASQIWTWLYLSNLAPWWDENFASTYPLSHLWSLAIEEQFYLVWPLVIFSLSRSAAVKLCLFIIPATFVGRCVLISMGVSEGQIYSTTFCRLDTLAVGALIALTIRGPAGLAGALRPAKIAAALGAIGILGVFVKQRTLFEGPWLFTIGLTAVAVCCGGVLVLVLAARTGSIVSRILNNALLRSLGKYSYAMYLFHLPVQLYVSYHWWTREPILNGQVSPIVGQLITHLQLFVVTYLLAMASWWLFESHVLKLKRFFEYRKDAQSGSPAVSPAIVSPPPPPTPAAENPSRQG